MAGLLKNQTVFSILLGLCLNRLNKRLRLEQSCDSQSLWLNHFICLQHRRSKHHHRNPPPKTSQLSLEKNTPSADKHDSFRLSKIMKIFSSLGREHRLPVKTLFGFRPFFRAGKVSARNEVVSPDAAENRIA